MNTSAFQAQLNLKLFWIIGNFTCVQVVFRFKRRLGYYLFHTYIPTCLIVIMSWISFWIKPEAVPARVTLCVTSLLTLSTVSIGEDRWDSHRVKSQSFLNIRLLLFSILLTAFHLPPNSNTHNRKSLFHPCRTLKQSTFSWAPVRCSFSPRWWSISS